MKKSEFKDFGEILVNFGTPAILYWLRLFSLFTSWCRLVDLASFYIFSDDSPLLVHFLWSNLLKVEFHSYWWLNMLLLLLNHFVNSRAGLGVKWYASRSMTFLIFDSWRFSPFTTLLYLTLSIDQRFCSRYSRPPELQFSRAIVRVSRRAYSGLVWWNTDLLSLWELFLMVHLMRMYSTYQCRCLCRCWGYILKHGFLVFEV